jgi:hypothetical protein
VKGPARRSLPVLLAALLLAGCATASPPPRRPAAAEAPRRCSPADPDRWTWFCVMGQIFYAAASFFSPPNELAPPR